MSIVQEITYSCMEITRKSRIIKLPNAQPWTTIEEQ